MDIIMDNIDNTRSPGGEGTSGGAEHDASLASPEILSDQYCVQHEDNVVLHYCKEHQINCCVMCKADHRQCELLDIEDIHHKLSVFTERLQYVIHCTQNKRESLELYSKRIKPHLQYGKTKIRSYFDRIRAVVNDAEREALRNLTQLGEDEIKLVNSYLNENCSLKEQLRNIKEACSRFGGFVAEACEINKSPMSTVSCRDALEFTVSHEDTVAFIEKRLDDVHETTKKINENAIVRDNILFDQIISNLKGVVKISPLHISSKPSPKLSFIKDKKIDSVGHVYDITMPPDKRDELFIVTRYPNALKCINMKGDILRCAKLPDNPYSFCIYSNTLAIAFPDSSKVRLYNVSDLVELDEIQLSGGCSGICRLDDSFVVSCWDQGVVKTFNDIGEVVNSSESIFRQPGQVTTSEYCKYILVFDGGNNRVVVMNTNLKQVFFTLSHSSLTLNYGLCAATGDRVYVSCYKGNCIVEFTIDGQYVSTILHSNNGISQPSFLCYDKHRSLLAVVVTPNDTDNIQFYKERK